MDEYFIVYKFNINTNNMSRNKYLKTAKRLYKYGLKNLVMYNEKRDQIVSSILNSHTPNCGCIQVKLMNH